MLGAKQSAPCSWALLLRRWQSNRRSPAPIKRIKRFSNWPQSTVGGGLGPLNLELMMLCFRQFRCWMTPNTTRQVHEVLCAQEIVLNTKMICPQSLILRHGMTYLKMNFRDLTLVSCDEYNVYGLVEFHSWKV